MKKRNLIIFIIIIISVGSVMLKNFSYLPTGIRHFYHLLVAPKNLYSPIVKDQFQFKEKGFSKTYKLEPKYFDYYDLSINFLNESISSEIKFNGKIFVEFLYEGKVVLEKIADRILSANYAGNDINKYKKITLLTFEIPINKKYKNNLQLRITVIEPDQIIVKHDGLMELQVAVSTTP